MIEGLAMGFVIVVGVILVSLPTLAIWWWLSRQQDDALADER